MNIKFIGLLFFSFCIVLLSAQECFEPVINVVSGTLLIKSCADMEDSVTDKATRDKLTSLLSNWPEGDLWFLHGKTAKEILLADRRKEHAKYTVYEAPVLSGYNPSFRKSYDLYPCPSTFGGAARTLAGKRSDELYEFEEMKALFDEFQTSLAKHKTARAKLDKLEIIYADNFQTSFLDSLDRVKLTIRNSTESPVGKLRFAIYTVSENSCCLWGQLIQPIPGGIEPGETQHIELDQTKLLALERPYYGEVGIRNHPMLRKIHRDTKAWLYVVEITAAWGAKELLWQDESETLENLKNTAYALKVKPNGNFMSNEKFVEILKYQVDKEDHLRACRKNYLEQAIACLMQRQERRKQVLASLSKFKWQKIEFAPDRERMLIYMGSEFHNGTEFPIVKAVCKLEFLRKGRSIPDFERIAAINFEKTVNPDSTVSWSSEFKYDWLPIPLDKYSEYSVRYKLINLEEENAFTSQEEQLLADLTKIPK